MGKRAQQASGHHTHSRTHLLTHTIRSVQLLFTLMCGSRLQYLIVFLSLLHSFASYSMSHLIAFENFEHFRSNRSNLSTFIHWETPVLYTAQFIQITWVFLITMEIYNMNGEKEPTWSATSSAFDVYSFGIFILHRKFTFCLLPLNFKFYRRVFQNKINEKQSVYVSLFGGIESEQRVENNNSNNNNRKKID